MSNSSTDIDRDALFTAIDMTAQAADASLVALRRLWDMLDDDQIERWIQTREGRIPDVRTFVLRLLPHALP
jgi:hypothetical protein